MNIKVNGFGVLFSFIMCTAAGEVHGNCDQGLCPYDINEGSMCYKLTSSGCEASISGISYKDGEPLPPTRIGGAICDACDSDQDHSVNYSYTVTNGWKFCVSASFGATWKLPALTPEWTVEIGCQLCFDSQTSRTVNSTLNCARRTKTKVDVYEIKTPSTVTINIQYTKWGEYVQQDPFPPYCASDHGQSFRDERLCGEDQVKREIMKHSYYSDFDDLTCPAGPPVL